MRLKHRSFTVILLLALACIGAFIFARSCSSDSSAPTLSSAAVEAPRTSDTTATPPGGTEQLLYFGTPEFTALAQEKRAAFYNGDNVADRAKVLWDELKVSADPTHLPLIPKSLTPSSVLLGAGGQLLVDLPPASLNGIELGTAWEQWFVVAVTNTMVRNLSGVNSVKFLVDGKDRPSLLGHLQTQQAQRPRLDAVVQ